MTSRALGGGQGGRGAGALEYKAQCPSAWGRGLVLPLLSIVLEQLLSPSMVHVVVPGTIYGA